MLLRGCVGVGVGVRVRVEWVLPWRGWILVRSSAGVFFLKVSLYDVDDLGWGYDYVVGVVSLMASSLGWSFALGCSPAAVLRVLW